MAVSTDCSSLRDFESELPPALVRLIRAETERAEELGGDDLEWALNQVILRAFRLSRALDGQGTSGARGDRLLVVADDPDLLEVYVTAGEPEIIR